MDDKVQSPPAYTEASAPPSAGAYNAGYMSPPGDQGAAPPPPPGTCPPQAPGYGYPQHGMGYQQAAPGYQPPGYTQPGYPQPGYPQPGYPQSGYPQGYGFQQQAVVMSQPTAGGAMVNHVPDHMGLAIFTTICCCWPLGLVAIMRAQEARRALDRGDLATASNFSQESRRFSLFAIAGGCVSIVLAVVIIIVVITQNTYYYDYND